jgi:hypothetical protein
MSEQTLYTDTRQESSNAVREIISSDPGFWTRNGTVIFFILLLISGLSTWFIKYPEIISSNARLTGTNAPKPIATYEKGRLVHLFKQNGDYVRTNDIVGCMETTADWSQILQLSAMMDSLSDALINGNSEKIGVLMSRNYENLGELQNSYLAFRQAYMPFMDYVSGDFANKKKALLYRENTILERSKKSLEKRKQLYNEDVSLIQTTLDKNKQLLGEKVISEEEYRQMVSQSIARKVPVQEVESSVQNIAAQQNDKQKELLEINNNISTQQILFKEAVNNFKSDVNQWKHIHLLTATIEGTLSFTTFLEQNQQLESGIIIAFILPKGNNYYLQTFIPQNNFGKVSKGQKVLLKFPAYSWQEYGSVTGVIDYISPIPSDSGYLAKINLPKGLTTNHNKKILYREGLSAQAEIITKDIRLLQRLYYSITKMNAE